MPPPLPPLDGGGVGVIFILRCARPGHGFRVAPPLELKRLETIFQHKMFGMLLAKGKISKEMIAMLSTWRHSGFHVFCGNRISPNDDTAMENLARYIIRASFSQERILAFNTYSSLP